MKPSKTRAGVGLSGEQDTEAAAREAIHLAMNRAGIERADFVVLFATPHHFAQYRPLMKWVQEETGAKQVAGCSGYGVLTSDGEIEDAPGIAILAAASDQISAHSFLCHPLRGQGHVVGEEIAKKAQENLSAGSDPLVLLLPDTYRFQPEPLFESLQEVLGPIPIVGGGASEDGSQGRTYQFCNGQVESDAVSGLIFKGTFSADIHMTQACRPLGDPWVVTRADRNVIYELGGRPALEVLSEATGESLVENPQLALTKVFIGLPKDPDDMKLERGSYLVRNIVGVDPESGAIGIPEIVSMGQAIYLTLREGEGARRDLAKMVDSISSDSSRLGRGPASFGFYFNCAGRGSSLYGKPSVDVETIRERLGDIPIIGFFTGAEIAPIRQKLYLHQYSGVLVLFSDVGAV